MTVIAAEFPFAVVAIAIARVTMAVGAAVVVVVAAASVSEGFPAFGTSSGAAAEGAIVAAGDSSKGNFRCCGTSCSCLVGMVAAVAGGCCCGMVPRRAVVAAVTAVVAVVVVTLDLNNVLWSRHEGTFLGWNTRSGYAWRSRPFLGSGTSQMRICSCPFS